MVSRKTLNTLLASAVALTIAGGAATASAQHTEGTNTADKEKCYGVVKTAANDCASASGSHSCAGHASVDGSGEEWIALPAGVCDKLVNGSLTPVSGGAAPAPAAEAPAEAAPAADAPADAPAAQ
jgi:uncharacterized membrane protein